MGGGNEQENFRPGNNEENIMQVVNCWMNSGFAGVLSSLNFEPWENLVFCRYGLNQQHNWRILKVV